MCVRVFSTQVEGKGNGIKTVIVNMVDVAKALCRPPSCKWGWLLPIVNWGVAHTHIIHGYGYAHYCIMSRVMQSREHIWGEASVWAALTVSLPHFL